MLKVKQLEKKLSELKIDFQISHHPPIKTVEGGLRYLGIEASEGCSTLILKAGNKFIAVHRRDDHQLDLDKVKKALGVKSLEMATKEEILEQTGAFPGATPLITGLPTLMDESVLEKEYVYGGTGDFEYDLKIRPRDLQRITKAETADIITKRRVFSGSRPTGRLHLGNYLGGLKGYLALQKRRDLDCIYSVVDLHGITTPFEPNKMQIQIREVVLDYLGCGLDPQKCHFQVQSQVPEHMELAYYLSTIYPVSRVEQLPTYKDKKKENPDYINVGLFYYPILMAADILLYKAELVPVGIDQEPHLELTREIARKFNRMFKPIFPEPQRFATPGEYVPSLLGEGKMSKSIEGSYILLTDGPKTIKTRLAKAPTDTGKGKKVPSRGGVANLLTLVELFQGKKAKQEYERQYLGRGIKYSRLKEDLAQAIFKELKPIQEKRKYYQQRPKLIDQVLEEGRAYCSQIAEKTMVEVKQATGMA